MGCCFSVRVIEDQYTTIAEVQSALRDAGLTSSNLIFGIDYTCGNATQGKESNGGRSLHDISESNPYVEVMEILGQTLEPFDEDRIIPTYGFGDILTQNRSIFPFYPDRQSVGVTDVLRRYKQITPQIQMSGPLNFAPLIRETIEIVKSTNSYHILVIITHGQFTNASIGPMPTAQKKQEAEAGAPEEPVAEPAADTPLLAATDNTSYSADTLTTSSKNLQNTLEDTKQALIDASNYPLSIICVGVGDGPFTELEKMDNDVQGKKFDNFQFVSYSDLKKTDAKFSPSSFAIQCLQEIPTQYNTMKQLNYFQDEDE